MDHTTGSVPLEGKQAIANGIFLGFLQAREGGDSL